MVKFSKLLGYTLFFLLALIYFMPKSSLYYYAEEQLQKFKIVLSGEKIQEDIFSLKLHHTTISYDSVESASVQEIDMKIFFLYNSLQMQDIELSQMAAAFIPLHIDSVDVKYTLLNPLYVVTHSKGEFGEADIKISILDRNMSMVVVPSEMMLQKYQSTLHMLKKNEEGEYHYDKAF